MWQRGRIYGTAAPWVYHYGVVAYDVGGVVPAVKHRPVVSTDDECELAVGVAAAQVAQRVPHVRRPWQRELAVAGVQLGVGGECAAHHVEPQPVVEERRLLLQRVLR